MERPLSPQAIAASLSELWSPRVIGSVDEHYVKVAKVQGELGWHAHAGEDELFFVLSGRLRIEMEAGAVELGPGEMYVVPKGVRHHPLAREETHLLLFERKSTLHTGGNADPAARSIEEQLRPL